MRITFHLGIISGYKHETYAQCNSFENKKRKSEHEIWQQTSLNLHSTVHAECGMNIEYWTFDIDGSTLPVAWTSAIIVVKKSGPCIYNWVPF